LRRCQAGAKGSSFTSAVVASEATPTTEPGSASDRVILNVDVEGQSTG